MGLHFVAGLMIALALLDIASADLPSGLSGCHQLSKTDIDSSNCDSLMRQTPSFEMLYRQLNESITENATNYTIYVTKWMYRNLYCGGQVEAVLVLYYDYDFSNIYDADNDWWTNMAPYAEKPEISQLFLGRRRGIEEYPNEEMLLLDEIRTVMNETSPDCIQWLIDQFKGAAGDAFKRDYPVFHVPSTLTATATLPPTATPPPTLAAATSPAASLTTSPYQPSRCTVCDGLECWLAVDPVETCTEDEPLCVTILYDTDHGREIFRGCANMTLCDSPAYSPACEDVDKKILDEGTTCQFCCLGDNCNIMPLLIPEGPTRYNGSSSH